MRYKKKELLQTLETLDKVNRIIKNANTQTLQSMSEALVECQTAAIEIGTYLETRGEAAQSIVRMLEEYCESIYQQSVCLNDVDACREITKKVQKQLRRIIDSIRYDLPEDKKEIVFLPYKAAMWDSLESIYLAAKEDETVEAYVIPIPYFDKNPDGTLGEMHYEGNEYPSNIEVTDWKNYDFENRRPDVVYIHNPYDAWNYVTSVHPNFYAENLKKYTDKLVYVPYFVLQEIEPDNQAVIDNMKHFCFLPGTIYADKVIVQSEKMKQIYVNEYLKAAEANGLPADRKSLEEKILGLGSPKFDKVLNTKKEDLEIPKEWLKVIQKPDGSWKKIIFYNTTIAALLAHDDKMLDKIEDVLRIFKENEEEVALLWRPHPLIESTIQSMRPRLWERYREIVDGYQSEGWGIYDDTADMDRAVALSDAYYGDQSSVVQVYQKTGKLIMLQNVEINNHKMFPKQERFKPQIIKCLLKQDSLYFFAGNYNALYYIDLNSGIAKVVDSIQAEMFNRQYLLGDLVLQNNCIFWAKVNAENLHYYDCRRHKTNRLTGKGNRKSVEGMYSMIAATEKNVYLLPATASKVIKIDTEKLTIEKTIDIREKLNRELGIEYQYLSNSGWHCYKETIYFVGYDRAILIALKMEDDSVDFNNIEEIPTGIIRMVGEKENLYLLGKDQKVYQYNLLDSRVTAVIELEKDYDYTDKQGAFQDRNKIYFFSYVSNELLVVDLSKKSSYCTTITDEWNIESDIEQEQYKIACVDDTRIIAVSNANILQCIRRDTLEHRKILVRYEFEQMEKIIDAKLTEDLTTINVITENNIFMLNQFITSDT